MLLANADRLVTNLISVDFRYLCQSCFLYLWMPPTFDSQLYSWQLWCIVCLYSRLIEGSWGEMGKRKLIVYLGCPRKIQTLSCQNLLLIKLQLYFRVIQDWFRPYFNLLSNIETNSCLLKILSSTGSFTPLWRSSATH